MSVPNKERFIKTNLKIQVEKSNVFPPPIINYEGKILNLLGTSNKEDLMPVNIQSPELQRVVTYGTMKQFIYSAINGDVYDICIYQDETGAMYIYGIRTRQLPDKKGGNNDA